MFILSCVFLQFGIDARTIVPSKVDFLDGLTTMNFDLIVAVTEPRVFMEELWSSV